MSDFGPTELRLQRIEARMPGFPVGPMRLVRMTHQLQKMLRDATNAVLRPYNLTDTSYVVLAILYGSDGETSTATALSEATQEKPANLTRVCDDLVLRGLIDRTPKPGDRRAVMITLSDAGRDLIERALPDVSDIVSAAFADVTPAELERMAELNLRVLGNLDKQE
ncbi:MarR family transcriptional regulator [Massilia sp. TW-1]|uniref:MarR family transcriptional regulator n=1 Tax=Telluria antibiotica TaxID=2717319 RepID=A0ABX0PKH9_9BURK|nr:MarR family transcriptional regulator [Telluria antibiotica]NIA56893.1 MarR family transcriptional regulator [Telluria antibiotica]